MSDVPTVHQRMARVVQALSHIPKQTSQGVSYEFRGIDAVMGALHGPLADNGLYLSPRVLDDWQVNGIPGTNNRTQHQALFRVCVDVYAEDGSMTTLGPGLAQSHDYGDKAVYQAQQNAIKYLLLEAFCIPTSEQDMDAREADPSPTVDLSELDRVIAEAQKLGLEGDYDGTREYALQSQGHADTAAGKLRRAIAEKQAKDDGSASADNDVPSEQEEGDATEPGKPAERSESGEGEEVGHATTSGPSSSIDESPSPDTPNPCKTCGPQPRASKCPDCPGEDPASLAERAKARAEGGEQREAARQRIREAFSRLNTAGHTAYPGLHDRLERIVGGPPADTSWGGASVKRLEALADDAERLVGELEPADA